MNAPTIPLCLSRAQTAALLGLLPRRAALTAHIERQHTAGLIERETIHVAEADITTLDHLLQRHARESAPRRAQRLRDLAHTLRAQRAYALHFN
jgi:hypothetical protein